MRLFLLSLRISPVLKIAIVATLGGILAGCSSGFSRFDTSVYDSVTPQNTAARPLNTYPGDVDPLTTAGIGKRIVPAFPVAPKIVPQGVYHPQEPTYAQRDYSSASYQKPVVSNPSNNHAIAKPPVIDSRGWNNSKTIQRTQLPEPVAYAPEPGNIDSTKTASISSSAKIAASVETGRENGWTSTGGTRITVRSGETLYNLSKRYGVPVAALKQANGMNSASQLHAGQQILIPNYVYSSSAPISAPDNNPQTRASRASTGMIGEVHDAKVDVPSQKPAKTAATTTNNPPVDTVSGESSGTYTVKSGDSLSRIGQQYGVSIAALQSANGLSGSDIRIGQKLVIPDAGQTLVKPTQTAGSTRSKTAADPVVTGSLTTAKTSTVAAFDADVAAPKRSGISEFRWPVRGRVVAVFGEGQGNGKNDGIDISVPEGTAVRSAENGVVIYTGNEVTMYGKLVLIRHEDGWVSAYAHNRQFEVQKGDTVRRGQIIARSGRTGETDRPKLHFELRKNSNPVDPEKYLAGA